MSSSACIFMKKKTLVEMFSHEFCKKKFKAHFFMYISKQLLLEEHWISLKMVPRTIAINVSTASYQKQGVLFSFLRSAFGKFEEIFVAFLILEFSLSSKQLFPANCLCSFFNSCLMLIVSKLQNYKWKCKQKILHKNYLKLSQDNP